MARPARAPRVCAEGAGSSGLFFSRAPTAGCYGGQSPGGWPDFVRTRTLSLSPPPAHPRWHACRARDAAARPPAPRRCATDNNNRWAALTAGPPLRRRGCCARGTARWFAAARRRSTRAGSSSRGCARPRAPTVLLVPALTPATRGVARRSDRRQVHAGYWLPESAGGAPTLRRLEDDGSTWAWRTQVRLWRGAVNLM